MQRQSFFIQIALIALVGAGGLGFFGAYTNIISAPVEEVAITHHPMVLGASDAPLAPVTTALANDVGQAQLPQPTNEILSPADVESLFTQYCQRPANSRDLERWVDENGSTLERVLSRYPGSSC